MAVDKLSGTPNFVQILSSGVSLEDALARFDEQCSRHEPSVIRKRLRKHLTDVQINIDRRSNDEAL
jgi:hypothetical protein